MYCRLFSLTHGLLAHSTLVCVPGRLVVVGVGNEASTHSKQCERLDLQVCCVSRKKRKNKLSTSGIFSFLNVSCVTHLAIMCS